MQIWDRWERVSHSYSVRMISLRRLTWQPSFVTDTTISSPLLPLIVCAFYLSIFSTFAVLLPTSILFSLWQSVLSIFSTFNALLSNQLTLIFISVSRTDCLRCIFSFFSAARFWFVIFFLLNNHFVRYHDEFHGKTTRKWKQTTKNLAKHSSQTSKNIYSRWVKKLKEILWPSNNYFSLNWLVLQLYHYLKFHWLFFVCLDLLHH